MADNTTLNSMSGGDTIQTEDFGASGKIQRIKLALGAKDIDLGDVASGGNAMPATLDTLIAGEDLTNNKLVTEFRYSNFNISTATTTTVKSGAGYVDEIIIVGGTLGNVTIYDNTGASGTVLCPAVTPVSGAIILKHCTFAVGLTIVTAAATVITGSYR